MDLIFSFVIFMAAMLLSLTASITMILPLLVGLMMLWGVIGIIAPIVILGIIGLQVILMIRSETNSAIHDRLAYTVVVDYNSQLIFNTPDEAIAYRDSINKTETIFRD